MPRTLQLRVPADRQGVPAFPERCVSCGMPKQAESTILLSRLVTRGRGGQEEVALRCQVPHCQRCARATRSLFMVSFIPFILGFLIVGGLAFVGAALGSSALGIDSVGQPRTTENSLVIGAAAGLILGLLAGFLLEALARVLLLPLFGRALLRAPLLAAEFISGSSYVAGLKARLTSEADYLELKFANDEIAGEVEQLNAHLLQRRPAGQ